MSEQRAKYQLKVRFEIEKVWVDENNRVTYNGYGTGERLTIEDSWDLAEPMTLTKVLATIDKVHETIKEAPK